jgi:hypothetical protein
VLLYQSLALSQIKPTDGCSRTVRRKLLHRMNGAKEDAVRDDAEEKKKKHGRYDRKFDRRRPLSAL